MFLLHQRVVYVHAGVGWTDVLTAIGTVLAVIVALGLGLWGAFGKRFTSPKLTLTIDVTNPPNRDLVERPFVGLGGGGPWLSDSGERVPAGESRASAWVRARVYASRSAAFSVEVVVVGARLRHGDATKVVRIDGQSLLWSQRTSQATQLDIPAGASRLVDVASITKHSSTSLAPLSVQTDFRAMSDNPHIVHEGVLEVDLAVVAHNAQPTYYRVVLTYDGKWPDTEKVWDHLSVSASTLEWSSRLLSGSPAE